MVIFTDSRVATLMIKSPKSSYRTIVDEIKKQILEINKDNKIIQIQWVKAHSNISGNEMADKAANLGHDCNKSALFPLHMEEYLSMLKAGFKKHWEESWKFAMDESGKGLFIANIKDTIDRCPWWRETIEEQKWQ